MIRKAHRFVAPLWIVWAGLLFGGMILNSQEHIGSSGFLKATRLASSFALVAAAWFWAAGAEAAKSLPALVAIAIGMTLGFVGDVSNADLLTPNPEHSLIGGALAFGLGHIAYIWAFVRARRDLGLARPSWPFAILAWQIVGAAGWYFVVHPASPKLPIHWIALPYALLLAGTAGATTGLALANRRFLLLALGGAAFLASDLVLAIGQFRKEVDVAEELVRWTGWVGPAGREFLREVARNSVWLLYGPAQMLIVYSMGSLSAAYRRRSVDSKERPNPAWTG